MSRVRSLLFSVGSAGLGTSLAVLVLRIGFSATMVYGHGLRKIQNFEELLGQFRDPLGLGSELSLVLAIFAEVFCSVLVALGLATRLALIPLMTTMGVALFLVHADDPFSRKEMALVYLLCYVALFLAGPGRFSLDQILTGRRSSRR